MEQLVDDIKNLEVGDVLLVDNAIGENITYMVAFKYDKHKYDIVTNKDNPERSLGLDEETKEIKTISAQEEGCNGDEKIKVINALTNSSQDPHSDLEINEINQEEVINNFNIRKISEDHELYNEEGKEGVKMLSQFLKEAQKIEGGNHNKEEEEKFLKSMFKIMGYDEGENGENNDDSDENGDNNKEDEQ